MTVPDISLADSRAIRSQVYQRFAFRSTPTTRRAYSQQLNQLGLHIASIRTGAYDQRLAEYATQLGVAHPSQLTDAVRLADLSNEARNTASRVRDTYNRDLRSFIAQQPPGTSQAALTRSTAAWQRSRADWKTLQIAKTEAQTGRALAEHDVMARNGFVVLQRASPQGAQCPQCKALVARGWLRPDQLDFSLPLHPHCVHSLEAADTIVSQARSKDRLWLGSWAPNTGTKGQAA